MEELGEQDLMAHSESQQLLSALFFFALTASWRGSSHDAHLPDANVETAALVGPGPFTITALNKFQAWLRAA